MFERLTKKMQDGRTAGRTYRRAVDRSIGLDEARARVLVDNVFRFAQR
jgi:hypothetical protein